MKRSEVSARKTLVLNPTKKRDIKQLEKGSQQYLESKVQHSTMDFIAERLLVSEARLDIHPAYTLIRKKLRHKYKKESYI